MKPISYIAVCLLTLLLLSCSEDDPKQQEGYFRLAQVQSPTMRAGAKTHDVSETSFDLGSVKASREFYFLLANGLVKRGKIIPYRPNTLYAMSPS